MSNSAQDPSATEGAKSADTPMDTSFDKGKGKASAPDAMEEDDEEESGEDEVS